MLKRPAAQFKKAKGLTDQLCELCDAVDREVSTKIERTGRRIEQLEEVQMASAKYWTIVGSTVGVLIGIKLVSGGWNFWKWLKQRKKMIPEAKNSQDEHGRVESSERRLHPRDWNISN